MRASVDFLYNTKFHKELVSKESENLNFNKEFVEDMKKEIKECEVLLKFINNLKH